MSIISELCRGLVEINKSQYYNLIDKLIHLILTLSIFFATIKLAFSTIKHVKIVFHNKIKNEFLVYFMMIYIEWELAKDIDLDSIIDKLYSTKHRMVQFW